MKIEDIIDRVDWDRHPLIPAIAQEYASKNVLMLAYMSRESLKLTLEKKVAHYYSRSRDKIWKKGEESGNIQNIKNISLDCDSDTLLLEVEQIGGAACHTGRESCFFNKIDIDSATLEVEDKVIFDPGSKYSIVDRLFHIIEERKREPKDSSYTSSLFKKGENSILKKIAEESAELSFAIKDGDEKEIVYECADLLYHTLVALSYKNISPSKVKDELARRFGVGGLEEKASRGA